MPTPFAYRLKSIRVQQGVTQAVLAEAIGVSKQAISQYENGRKNPESGTLVAIARFFQKPVGYFYQPVQTRLKKVDFRKRARLNGRALEAVKVTILDRLEPYLELEHVLGIDSGFTNPLADMLIQNVKDAEQAALSLLRSWDLGTNPIPNIIEMLEDRGIKVISVKVDRQFDGLSTLVNDTIPVIVVNSEMDTLRKRFTVMHELGHLLLRFPNNADKKFCEKACNRFAGAMLLPAAVMVEEIGMHRTQISFPELIAIKEYYGISLAAIIYRGLDLGVFAQSLGRRFWSMHNQNPALKSEKGYGQYHGEEQSHRFQQLLSKALVLELISYSKAAQMAGIDIQQLRAQHQLV